jgi:hypothetical protein
MTEFWRRPSLMIAFVAASTSGVVILLHALGWITLAYSIQIVSPLALFLFVGLLVGSGRGREDVLMDRMRGGLIAGTFGLVAYDVIRLLVLWSGLVPFNPFRPIEVYGLLITDAPADTVLTKTLGWAFHLWNGLSFAMMYTLVFGKGRLLWAFGWAMLLELMMVASYPSIFRMVADWAFVTVGSIGHVAYGLTLGWTARRVVKW